MLLCHVPLKFVSAFSLTVSKTLSFLVKESLISFNIVSTWIQLLIRLFSVNWFYPSGVPFVFTDLSQLLIDLLSHMPYAEILPEASL